MTGSYDSDDKNKLVQFLIQLAKVQSQLGVTCYFVGGCVRDAFYGFSSLDYDLSIDGDVSSIVAYFQDTFQFSTSILDTAKIRIGKYHVDFAKFRSETYITGNGLPSISSGDIQMDLNRRDFTINTGYVLLDAQNIRKIVSPENLPDCENTQNHVKIELAFAHAYFLEDIQNKVIRVLHEKSFFEDPSRLLRAIKYMTSYGLKMEATTARLFDVAVKNATIETYSVDRFRQMVYTYSQSAQGMVLLENLYCKGVLMHLGRTNCEHAVQKREAVVHVKSYFTQLDIKVVFLLLLYERELAFWFTADRRISQYAKACDLFIEKSRAMSNDVAWSKWKIYELLHGMEPECIAFALCSDMIPEFLAHHIKTYLIESRSIKLHCNGNDLIVLGLTEGKEIGKILHSLLEYKVNLGLDLNKNEEIKWIESYLYEHRN